MTLTEEQKERLEYIREDLVRLDANIDAYLKYNWAENSRFLLSIIDSLTSRVKGLERDLELALMDERVFRGHYAEQFEKTEALQSRLDRVEKAAKPIITYANT